MKNLRLLLLSFIAFLSVVRFSLGSDLDIVFNVYTYNSGYNVSCHGASDGSIEAIIVGGDSPYSFSWSNGSYSKNITALPAGVYTLTVTDANNDTYSKSVEITQAKPITEALTPFLYDGGYNISAQGEQDGSIKSDVTGGVPPYSYLWSTGDTKSDLGGLSAGAYTLTVTDANSCSVSASATLTQPTPLHIVSITSVSHHGYNVSCYKGDDGAIDLTVAGGVQPYSYKWNNGKYDEDISSLKADTFKVEVTDANKAKVNGAIVLTQPDALKDLPTLSIYNGFNLSCHDCGNGSITSHITGGVSPFTYSWKDGQATSANLYNQQAGFYAVTVTDANGCTSTAQVQLTAPDAENWSMNGNANTDTTKFIGTKDTTDLVFKTNNSERLRITKSGNVKLTGGLSLNSLSSTGYFLYADQQGNVLKAPIHPVNAVSCTVPITPWYPAATGINDITNCQGKVGINTTAPQDALEVNGASRFTDNTSANYVRISDNGSDALIDKVGVGELKINSTIFVNDAGQVGIGVEPNSSSPTDIYKLFVKGGIITEKVMVAIKGNDVNIWPDYVFSKNYDLQKLDELEKYINDNNHLPDVPSACEVDKGVDLLQMQIEELKKIEELTLYVIQLKKENDELKKIVTNK